MIFKANKVYTHRSFLDVNFKVLNIKEGLTGRELLITWIYKRNNREIADDIIFVPVYKELQFTEVCK